MNKLNRNRWFQNVSWAFSKLNRLETKCRRAIFSDKAIIFGFYLRIVRFFVNCAIFYELCDRMRFEVSCAKLHHRIISDSLHVHVHVHCSPLKYSEKL